MWNIKAYFIEFTFCSKFITKHSFWNNVFYGEPAHTKLNFNVNLYLGKTLLTEYLLNIKMPTPREQLLQVFYKQLLKLLNLLISVKKISLLYKLYTLQRMLMPKLSAASHSLDSIPTATLKCPWNYGDGVSVKSKVRNSWEHTHTVGTHSAMTDSCSVSNPYTSDAYNLSCTPKISVRRL